MGSWLEGIGGSLYFPVGSEAPQLRTLSLWLRPIARGQRVSIFVDEVPVTTMPLKRGWNNYRLSLPGLLTPGEHSLRFWFRFTRPKGKGRSPAAFGEARLLPEGVEARVEDGWVGPQPVGGAGQALLAGPPAGWSFYLLPPLHSRFEATVAVTEGDPVDFIARVEIDGEAPVEVRRDRVAAGKTAKLILDLSAFGERPIRLSLDTGGPGGPGGPLGRAGWLRPRITMPAPPKRAVPTTRNVIIWAIDGLRDDRVGLGRGGDRAATPNIDLLAKEGAAATHVWSGGATALDGHERLLRPFDGRESLPALMAAAGRRVGLLSLSAALDTRFDDDFNTKLHLRRAGEPPETRILLREVDDWLDARKRQPFFLYVASDGPLRPFEPAEGYRQLYDRARPVAAGPGRASKKQRDAMIAYDAEVSTTDYWVGQLLALLQLHGVADDTLVIVVGTVGQQLPQDRRASDGLGIDPQVLEVPLILWHPGMRTQTRRPLWSGGDLGDVAATALSIAGAPMDWPGRDLSSALLEGDRVPPRPTHARLGNQVAARFGAWLLRGTGGRDLRLWNLSDDPTARTEIAETRPRALRALRDSMQDKP